jgi:hypothetical protein
VERHIRPMLSGLGAGTGTTVAHDTSMMPVTPARFTFLGPAALKEVRQALHGTATAADGISPRPCLDQCCNTVQNALPSPSQAQANHALPCTIGVAGVESGRVHHQRSCGADGRAAMSAPGSVARRRMVSEKATDAKRRAGVESCQLQHQ